MPDASASPGLAGSSSYSGAFVTAAFGSVISVLPETIPVVGSTVNLAMSPVWGTQSVLPSGE